MISPDLVDKLKNKSSQIVKDALKELGRREKRHKRTSPGQDLPTDRNFRNVPSPLGKVPASEERRIKVLCLDGGGTGLSR